MRIEQPPLIEILRSPGIVLSISPAKEDHNALKHLLPSPKWIVWEAPSLVSGLSRLHAEKRIPVVVCESNLGPGTWRDVLDATVGMDSPPHVIVTSRLADEHLWAEALNLGAYDVMAKPFDAEEVKRIVGYATLKWGDRYECGDREMVRAAIA